MKVGQLKASDVKRACESKLSIVFGKGREHVGWFRWKGKKVRRVTVPKGRDSVRSKTLKSMANQLNLTKPELGGLVRCRLRMRHYVEILRQRRVIED